MGRKLRRKLKDGSSGKAEICRGEEKREEKENFHRKIPER
jgi:hypothetical protein